MLTVGEFLRNVLKTETKLSFLYTIDELVQRRDALIDRFNHKMLFITPDLSVTPEVMTHCTTSPREADIDCITYLN